MTGFFDWLETKKYKLHVRVFLSKYRGYTLCPDCGGGRLRQEARDVNESAARRLPEICALTIKDAAVFFDYAESDRSEMGIADRILSEIRRRLKFLVEVGLDYLTLDRSRLDAFGRRSAAHSARDESRLFARRRALCAR